MTRALAKVLFVLLVILVGSAHASAVGAEGGAANSIGTSKSAFPTTSWALGVVVPDGAGLQNGGRLNWAEVDNVTVAVRLPNILLPDGVTYAVMSVMASDGSVMQAAAGVYPNRSVWLVYSWAIPDSASPVYRWILNGSEPAMPPGANVTISIFVRESGWELAVSDRDTGSLASAPFPSSIPPLLKAGEQEVFALESYSRSGATFQDMGNLTLQSVQVDGNRVTNGFYAYGNWDPSHNPSFVVGSAGTSPPSFISLEPVGAGSFVWGFADFFRGANVDYGRAALTTATLILTGVALVAVVAGYRLKSRRNRPAPVDS